MRVCLHCKAENPDDHRFCGSCGAALEAAEQPNATPVAVPESWDSLVAALKEDSSAPARLTVSALQWFRAGNLEDALLGAESALTLKPDYWAANLLAGVVKNQRGQAAAAEDHLQRAILSEPSAVYHKATLERELVRISPKKPWYVSSPEGRLGNRLLALAGAVMVIVGLIAISNQFGRRPNTGRGKPASGVVPSYGQSAPPQSPTAPQPGWQQNPGTYGGYPQTPAAPGQQYTPPTGAPASPAIPSGGHPTRDEASDVGTPITQQRVWNSRSPGELPPAQPDLSNLEIQPRSGGTQTAQAPQSNDGTAQAQQQGSGSAQSETRTPNSPPARPRVGVAGPVAPSTPPPGDRPPQATPRTWPQQSHAQPPIQPAPRTPQTPVLPENPSLRSQVAARPQTRERTAADLQREGLRLMRERRYAEAQEPLGQALQAYQQQISRGEDVEAARRALDATEALRRLAESRQ